MYGLRTDRDNELIVYAVAMNITIIIFHLGGGTTNI
jgi:hypothetical protein